MPTSEVMLGCRAYAYEDNANFFAGVCVGSVSAILHLAFVPALRPSLKICPPSEATYGQAVRAVTKWIEDHPEAETESFADLTTLALRSAWPCGR